MTFTGDRTDIIVKTGSDDLRGDSAVSFALFTRNGDQIASFMLKEFTDPGFVGESRSERSFPLPRRVALTELTRVELKLLQGGNVFETADNWNIDAITVELADDGSGDAQIWAEQEAQAPPLVRLTASQPTFVVFPGRR